MRESVDHLAMLRRNLASIAGGGRLFRDRHVSTGHAALDAALGGERRPIAPARGQCAWAANV